MAVPVSHIREGGAPWPTERNAYANAQAAPSSSTTAAIAPSVHVNLTLPAAGARPAAMTAGTRRYAGTGYPASPPAQCTAPDAAGRSCPANHGRSTTPTTEADTSGPAMSHATTLQVEELHTSSGTFVHRYLSTACLHGEHVYCASDQGQQGPKKPATCKFCEARCSCVCHPWSQTVTTPGV